MSPAEKRYRIVIPDGAKRIYVNCNCGAPLLRMQEGNHAVHLLQMSWENRLDIPWSSPELTPEMIKQAIKIKKTIKETIKRLVPEYPEDRAEDSASYYYVTAIRGRCRACHKRHDIPAQTIYEMDRDAQASLSFFGWLAHDDDKHPGETVSTKRPIDKPWYPPMSTNQSRLISLPIDPVILERIGFPHTSTRGEVVNSILQQIDCQPKTGSAHFEVYVIYDDK